MDMNMNKLTSIDEFITMQKQLVANGHGDIPTIVVSSGTCGQASGANALILAAKKELLQKKLTDKIRLRMTGCHGLCAMEPSILVEPRRTFYPKLSPDDMAKIIDAITKDAVVTELLFVDPETGKTIERQDDLPFFKKQLRTIMGRNEKVDPVRIHDYIENGGYLSLAKVISRNDPAFVLEEIKVSGLRGRGGTGFPTGQKWELFAAQKNSAVKYIICNANEGDWAAANTKDL
jgi:NADH-quinone oxidoreductase subunit F